jgi:hypothetical protein
LLPRCAVDEDARVDVPETSSPETADGVVVAHQVIGDHLLSPEVWMDVARGERGRVLS